MNPYTEEQVRFILNNYIKILSVLYVIYYLDNKKGYQLNDNLTYNWELLIF